MEILNSFGYNSNFPILKIFSGNPSSLFGETTNSSSKGVIPSNVLSAVVEHAHGSFYSTVYCINIKNNIIRVDYSEANETKRFRFNQTRFLSIYLF